MRLSFHFYLTFLRQRELGALSKLMAAPRGVAGLDLLFSLMAAVEMLILFYSALAPQQMLQSRTQIPDFSEQKKTKVYLKQKGTLVHLSLSPLRVMK